MRLLALIPLLLALALPASAGDDGQVYGPYHYVCDDGTRFTAVFDNRLPALVLTFAGGETLTLPQVLSGSGIRYADGRHEFWGKGAEAAWTVEGRLPTQCRTPDPF
jgi:membrane-bound inhibitor of C-type lysozyme